MKDPYYIEGEELALDASRLGAPKKKPRFKAIPPTQGDKEQWMLEEEERKYRESFPKYKRPAGRPAEELARDRATEILV